MIIINPSKPSYLCIMSIRVRIAKVRPTDHEMYISIEGQRSRRVKVVLVFFVTKKKDVTRRDFNINITYIIIIITTLRTRLCRCEHLQMAYVHTYVYNDASSIRVYRAQYL